MISSLEISSGWDFKIILNTCIEIRTGRYYFQINLVIHALYKTTEYTTYLKLLLLGDNMEFF